MYMTILRILLTLVIVQALVKFGVFFLVRYDTRRRMLDSQYAGKTTATKTSDLLLLGVGLYAGMTLIQTYFHEFSKPLAPTESPPEPISPIKMMSYAIQANPEKPWKELIVMTVLFIWVLYKLVAEAFGIS